MKLRAAGVAAALVGPALAVPVVAAHAQGFGLNEIGSCAIARAGANTSAPCADASSLYWNPGAVSSVPAGTSIYAGGSAISVKGNFKQDVTGRQYDGDVPTEVPPYLGLTVHTVPRLVLGLAGYVPYGLTSQWRDDFPGRFSALRASLKTIYVQPTVAYELVPGRLSVGAGGVVGYSTLELRQALDLSTSPAPAALVAGLGLPAGATLAQAGIQPGTEFGRARVKGSATGVGYNVGVHAKVTNTISFGARYLSEVRFRYTGEPATFEVSPRAGETRFPAGNVFQLPAGTSIAALVAPNFAAGAPLGPGQTASSKIDHPAQFQTGLSYTGLRNTTLSAEYAFIKWDSFQELPITFQQANGAANAALSARSPLIEDYKNSNSGRFALEHRFGPAFGIGADSAGVALRLGFSYATTPAPDETVTPLLPDMDRYNFAGGLGIPLGRGATLDLSYLRVETEGRRGRTGERSSRALTADQVNNGFYSLNANVYSASLKVRAF